MVELVRTMAVLPPLLPSGWGRPGKDHRRHRAFPAVPSPCRLLVLPLLAAVLAGCVPADQRPSGRVYPLPRHQPNDGLAVVSRPGGEGLHIWIETDTARPGVCRPRWLPDAARLRGGNGPQPTSFGLAPRQEFFQVSGAGDGASGSAAPDGGALPPAGPRQHLPVGAAPADRGRAPAAGPAPAGGTRPAQRPAGDPAGRKAVAGLPLTPDDREEPGETDHGGW
jgi:hypothetical protein